MVIKRYRKTSIPEKAGVKNTQFSVWSFARSAALGAILAFIIAILIAGMASIIGIAGSYLISGGLLSFEQLTALPTVLLVIALGSVVLSVILSACINHTLIRPLRLMSAAMNELARGNFKVRLNLAGKHEVREVSEFSENFNTAAKELEGTELMRSNFISDFSHEFRTPISSLSGFAQLLREGNVTAEEQKDYLDIIVSESERLTGLSERILALSKIEAVSIVPDIQEVDIAEQLRRATLVLEPKWSQKNVTIQLGIDECTIEGNKDYLSQLWINILDNAIKFSPEGGTVSIALYGGRQNEEERNTSNDEIVCWISDEGCGMDKKTQKHLFDKFYQGDTSHSSEGSGLGLALCKRVVDLHHGSIEVQSSENSGTVFEIRLPVSLHNHETGRNSSKPYA